MPRTSSGKGAALNKKVYSSNPNIYKCTRCGKEYSDPKGNFFVSKTSPLFVSNGLYTHICADCTNDLFFEMQTRYKDTKTALLIICHYLDIYFSETLYEQIKDNANFSFGNYCKLMNGKQYKAKSFVNSLMEIVHNGLREKDEIRNITEVKWSKSDLKNKEFVISSIGYDCFEDDNYTDSNRKFLFNTLANYLTDDVLEDPHKPQCVVTMVKTMLQVETIDRFINASLKQGHIDYELVDRLTGVKNKLVGNINSMANDNGISAKSSGKSNKGSNTLTNIMKEMQENGFEETKVNIVSSKMSASYQEIAKANAQALIEELNNTSDEYAQMVAKQSEMVSNLQNTNEQLNEEIRKLKVENKLLKSSIENKGDDK